MVAVAAPSRQPLAVEHDGGGGGDGDGVWIA